MRETRNHNTYLVSARTHTASPYSGRSVTPSPRAICDDKQRNFKATKRERDPELLKSLRKKDETLNLDIKDLQKELDRLNSPLHSSRIKKMTYSPTVKELKAPEPVTPKR
jgi:hypothetical protein